MAGVRWQTESCEGLAGARVSSARRERGVPGAPAPSQREFRLPTMHCCCARLATSHWPPVAALGLASPPAPCYQGRRIMEWCLRAITQMCCIHGVSNANKAPSVCSSEREGQLPSCTIRLNSGGASAGDAERRLCGALWDGTSRDCPPFFPRRGFLQRRFFSPPPGLMVPLSP